MNVGRPRNLAPGGRRDDRALVAGTTAVARARGQLVRHVALVVGRADPCPDPNARARRVDRDPVAEDVLVALGARDRNDGGALGPRGRAELRAVQHRPVLESRRRGHARRLEHALLEPHGDRLPGRVGRDLERVVGRRDVPPPHRVRGERAIEGGRDLVEPAHERGGAGQATADDVRRKRLPVDPELLRVWVAVALLLRPAPLEHDGVRAAPEERAIRGGEVGVGGLEKARADADGRDHAGRGRGGRPDRQRGWLALLEPDHRPEARGGRATADRVDREEPVLVGAPRWRPSVRGRDEHVVERHEDRHGRRGGRCLGEDGLEVDPGCQRRRVAAGAAGAEEEGRRSLAVDLLEGAAGVDPTAFGVEAEHVERRERPEIEGPRQRAARPAGGRRGEPAQPEAERGGRLGGDAGARDHAGLLEVERAQVGGWRGLRRVLVDDAGQHHRVRQELVGVGAARERRPRGRRTGTPCRRARPCRPGRRARS